MNEQGVTVWLTGLSGAGKSTIAEAAANELRSRGRRDRPPRRRGGVRGHQPVSGGSQ